MCFATIVACAGSQSWRNTHAGPMPYGCHPHRVIVQAARGANRHPFARVRESEADGSPIRATREQRIVGVVRRSGTAPMSSSGRVHCAACSRKAVAEQSDQSDLQPTDGSDTAARQTPGANGMGVVGHQPHDDRQHGDRKYPATLKRLPVGPYQQYRPTGHEWCARSHRVAELGSTPTEARLEAEGGPVELGVRHSDGRDRVNERSGSVATSQPAHSLRSGVSGAHSNERVAAIRRWMMPRRRAYRGPDASSCSLAAPHRPSLGLIARRALAHTACLRLVDEARRNDGLGRQRVWGRTIA
jgi:hypothetical protein